MAKPVVGIVMGSDSDWTLVKKACETLDRFGVAYEKRVISAHRTPEVALEYSSTAEERGLKVIIAAAGGAAHLAGVLAACTVLPVIGIPVAGGALNGLDALYATVQMPGGVPVATVACGSAGPVNAALLAVQILGTADPELRQRFHEHKQQLKDKVAAANAKIARSDANMKKILFASVLMGAAALSAAPNLLTVDTDFESGIQGWCGMNPSSAPIRAKDGAVGQWSMEFRNQVRSALLWDFLKPDTWYTFSYRLKGDRGKVELTMISDRWQYAGARSREVGTNGWRYCSYDFKTPANLSRAWYLVFRWTPGQSEDQRPTWCRVDGLKLEEGRENGRKEIPYEPAAVQFTAELDEPGEIHFEDDGAPVVKMRIAANASEGNLTARLRDEKGKSEFSANVASRGELAVSLNSATESGYYVYTAELVNTNGQVVAKRNVPFVVTRRAPANNFFGISYSSGSTLEALKRVGFAWSRSNTRWWQYEQVENRPFTGKEKCDINEPGRLLRLGTTGGVAPKWARGKNRKCWTDDPKLAIPFFEHLMRVTADTVDQYEIINEPDLMLPLQENGVTWEECLAHYAEIVRTIAPVIHRAGKPVVIDVSGVPDGNSMVDETLKRTGDAVDIVSIHSYSWPREFGGKNALSDPETGGFLDDVRKKMSIIDRYPGKRVVIGELGWALGMKIPYTSRDMQKYGWYLARMYLLARSFPKIEYLTWFSNGNTPEHGLFDYCLWRMNPEDGSRPTAAVAAACEAARELPEFGKGDVRQVQMDGLFLLAWERDGQARYAYWTDEDVDIPLEYAAEKPFAARSVFGKPLAAKGLALSPAPVYLAFASSDAAAVEARLVECLKNAYAKRPPYRRDEVEVKRMIVDDLAKVQIAGNPQAILRNERSHVMPPDPTVQWTGPEDLSAQILLGYDDNNFYTFISVRDDVHETPQQGKLLWQNDCVQLAFDPLDNARKNSRYMFDDCEFGFSLGQNPWCFAAPQGLGEMTDLQPIITRNGDITEYRIAIPWSRLGLKSPPPAMGFAMSLVDNDGVGKGHYYINFGNGISSGKHAGQFKRLLLK